MEFKCIPRRPKQSLPIQIDGDAGHSWRRPGGSSQLGLCSTSAMDRLPEELLVMVFKIHVWGNSDSPQRLLRVCRRWQNIANNTGSLWGDIILRDEETYKRILHTDRSLDHKTHCDSIKSLASAIERTKASKFELIIDFTLPDPSSPYNFELLNPSWFSDRCRALTIYKFDLFPEALSNLAALERLDINLGYRGMSHAALLEAVDLASPLLWHLCLRRSAWNGFSKYPKLAARLILLELTEITQIRGSNSTWHPVPHWRR